MPLRSPVQDTLSSATDGLYEQYEYGNQLTERGPARTLEWFPTQVVYQTGCVRNALKGRDIVGDGRATIYRREILRSDFHTHEDGQGACALHHRCQLPADTPKRVSTHMS